MKAFAAALPVRYVLVTAEAPARGRSCPAFLPLPSRAKTLPDAMTKARSPR